MAPSDSAMVSHSRSPITSDTGLPHSSAMPKSPRSTSFIQRRYCTHSGLFSPYCSRKVSASCCDTTVPDAVIWAT